MMELVWNTKYMDCHDFHKLCRENVGKNIKHKSGDNYFIKRITGIQKVKIAGQIKKWDGDGFYITIEQRLNGFGGMEERHQIGIPFEGGKPMSKFCFDEKLARFITYQY